MKRIILLVATVLFIAGCSLIEEKKVAACTDIRTGDIMGLGEAVSLARASSCVDEGEIKEEGSCNEVTGTWWLDTDIEREGCSPACVVKISTKEAEINWRCTGLIE